MSIHTRSILLIALILWILPNSLFSQFFEDLYGIDEGLPQNSILNISQDAQGYIWVFTLNGLCRFDGYQFKEYTLGDNAKTIRPATYGRIRTDLRNRKWILSLYTSLLVYQDQYDSFLPVKLNDSDQVPILSEFVDLGENHYLVSTLNGLHFITERDEFEFLTEPINQPEETGFIYRMILQEDGSLIAFADSGFFLLELNNKRITATKIKCFSNGASNEISFQGFIRFIKGNDSYLILTGWELYQSKIPVREKSFGDSEMVLDAIDLDFPEIGLNPGDPLFAVVKGHHNDLFIRSLHGIYRYDQVTGKAELIRAENFGRMDFGEGEFREGMFLDRQGVLWAGTDRGLLKIVIPNKVFHTIRPEPENPAGLQFGKLNSSLIDGRGHLWLGTVGDGLYHAVPDSSGVFNKFDHFLPDPDNPFSIHSSWVIDLFEDTKGILWVGDVNLQWTDPNKQPYTFNYTSLKEYAERIPADLFPTTLIEDRKGDIIAATANDHAAYWIYRKENKEGYFLFPDSAKHFLGNPLPAPFQGKDQQLYMYMDRCFFKWDDWVFHEVPPLPEKNSPEETSRINDLTLIPFAYPAKTDTLLIIDSVANDNEDYRAIKYLISETGDRKELWMTLIERNEIKRFLLNEPGKAGIPQHVNYKDDAFRSYSTGKGYIYDLIEDHRGMIWASTQDGLVSIDPESDQMNFYFEQDGLTSNQMYWGVNSDNSGRLFFCTTNGLVYFNPDSIRADPPPGIQLTDFLLFNHSVLPGSESILPVSLSQLPRLKLNYKQNFIGFRFSALEYRNTERVRYKYKLEGLNQEWLDADERRQADFYNLRPGKYTFKVIAANGNGVWNNAGTSLDIQILHPLWFKWWAIVLEGLIFLLLLLQYIRYRERNLKKQALILEQTVEEKTHQILEQRKEVDDLKSRFYTNISHEFRTPLTLLISPIDDALQNGQEEITVSRRIMEIMMRNARRLQRLINQLLDISKLESGKMELQLVKASLSDFVRTVASAFLSLAEFRDIQFNIHIEQEITETCFDTDKMETIISNLLSNAFKFCDQGGEVSLRLEYESNENTEKPAQAFLSIKDTGKGIDKEQLDKIFDRFYQVSDTETREVEGSGIGLALTKELVELMHGSIKVESAPGKGTAFKLAFPVSEECFSEHELEKMKSAHSEGDALVKTNIDRIEPVDIPDEMKELEDSSGSIDDIGEELILIVEDNPDLRSYICDKFAKQYRVLEAENGKDGLEKAIDHIPDLVITDLMMPEMGGVEMCRRLKEHPNTNHIPLIMLTAKADKDSRLEGLEASADDYISKPFDSDLLLARARNLITQRKDLRKQFEKEMILSRNETHTSSQRVWMLKEIIKVIDENLDDPDFDMATMTAHLHMSRTGIYRKIKAITGTTPHELLRLVRMKRAAAMLRSGEMNVTQVMYSVGMKNLSNFAVAFRKYFGVNPGEYKNGEPI